MSDLPSSAPARRLIVAMTGATGSIYGLRLLDAVRATPGWESHLIVSDAGMKADDALAYANQWDGAYMASFEPSDIASLKRLHQIAKAAGVVKNEPPDSAFATEPWERAKNIK